MTDATDSQIDSTISIQHRDGRQLHMQIASIDELPTIVDIYNENVSSKQVTADINPVSVSDRREWFDSHVTRPNRPIYVLKNSDDEIMAWGSFNDVTGRPVYHISSEISMYVAKQFQRQGLATILLDAMLSQAPKLGIKKVIALILAHNQPSRTFFKNAGFEKWGELPDVCDMDGFEASIIIMGISIA